MKRVTIFFDIRRRYNSYAMPSFQIEAIDFQFENFQIRNQS